MKGLHSSIYTEHFRK